MYKAKKIVISIILTILLFLGVTLTQNYKDSKEYKLDEVSIKNDTKINNKNLAIMVQKEDLSGYVESDAFPSRLKLNSSLSGCIDKYGDEIDGSIEYNVDTMSLKLKTKGSSYCYLYFIRDNEAPTITINTIDNYYTSAKVSISSNEESTYCVNTSSTSKDTSNCVLEGTISENGTIISKAFSESNTYYVHVKDSTGNETMSEALDIKVLYQKVEYIEATGTQYIETDYYPTSSTIGRLKFNVSNESGWMLYGYYNSEADTFRVFNYENTAYLDYGSGGGYNRISGGILSLNTINNIEFGNRYVRNLDTNTNIISNTSVSFAKKTTKAWIFDGKTSGKMYYVQIYEKDELVNNFISVFRISDGVIGMFEEINKKFYSSQVGTFEKGSNVS